MKAIKCEMCDGTDVIKQGEYYVCQSCGVKYETAAARKLMVEVDTSTKSENLYKLARRAKAEDNSENAAKYYGQLLELHPDDWEAYFYSAYYSSQNTTVANIPISASTFSSAIPTSMNLLAGSELSAEEMISAAEEMAELAEALGAGMISVALKSHVEFAKISIESANEHVPKLASAFIAALGIFEAIGDSVESEFIKGGGKEFEGMKDVAIQAWYRGMDLGVGAPRWLAGKSPMLTSAFWNERIQRYPIKVSEETKDSILGLNALGHELSAGQHKQLLHTLGLGNKIEAIKELRVMTGLGLKEAKEFVENELAVELDSLTPTQRVSIGLTSTPPASQGGGGGCYVATAVYGSYDCPQVWTLRRFRDYGLGTTRRGRAFIRAYYAISPKLVRRFGNTAWFKAMWRGRLDALVMRCKNNGYDDSPYDDIVW